ncbi:hypothetical protein TNCV_688911, partial [Trichonephila clavipes]
RHYSAVRSSLVESGTMTTTSTANGSRWVFVSFSVEAFTIAVRSRLGARGDDNDILPQTLGSEYSSLFFRPVTTRCPEASW